jgi:hypothetical protein
MQTGTQRGHRENMVVYKSETGLRRRHDFLLPEL